MSANRTATTAVGSRFWGPNEHAARANALPGEVVKVIGRTWITCDPGVTETLLRTELADLLRPLGAHPGARATDPATSHAAARHANPLDKWAVLDIHRAHPDGLTDFELADLMSTPDLPRKQTSVGVRRGELVKRHYLEDSGLKRLSDTGTPCIVWRLSAIGRATA